MPSTFEHKKEAADILQLRKIFRIVISGGLVVTWELVGVDVTGGQQRFFAKTAIAITFLVNIPARAFELIQGIPEILAINADTLICHLDSPYIQGIETKNVVFPTQ